MLDNPHRGTMSRQVSFVKHRNITKVFRCDKALELEGERLVGVAGKDC